MSASPIAAFLPAVGPPASAVLNFPAIYGQQNVTAFIPAATPTTVCPIAQCGKSRIASDCERQWCRKHCSDAGGCTSKNHRSTALPSTIVAPAIPPSQTPLPTSPFSTPTVAPVNPTTPYRLPPASQTSGSHSLNAQPNPRYVSHMPPIFTEQWQREQELQEEKRRQEATRVQYATQAKQAVTIYVWALNGDPAHVEEMQGMSWPYLPLTASILSHLKLVSSAGIQLYRHSIRTWVNISEGHVIDLQAHGVRIFLKARDVVDYPDFDTHLHTDSGNSPPNIRHKLKQERRELRERERTIRKGKDKAMQAVVELSSGSETDDDSRRPKKRHCPSPRSYRKPSVSPAVFKYWSFPGPSEAPVNESCGATDDAIEVSSDKSFPPTASPCQSTISTPITREPSPAPNPLPCNRSPAWPADYYAIDIVRMFLDCHKHPERPNKSIFEEHFPGVPYRRSTVSENHRRWTAAPQAVWDCVLRAKRAPEGLWSLFQSQSRPL